MWAETDESARLRSNSLVQAWLFLAILAVAFIGVAVLLDLSSAVGLYVSPPIARLGMGTFDYANLLFLVVWSWSLQLLSIHNGLQYRLQLGRLRVPRSRTSDVLIPIVFAIIAALWSALAHQVFAGRATNPTYLRRLPDGIPATWLQHGADEITTVYFLIIGLVLALIVTVHLFNPIDLEYEQRLRRILHLPASTKAT